MAKKRIAHKLDKELTPAMRELVSAGIANLQDGIDMPLSSSDKRKVIFRKYESHSPQISDTNHGDYWLEEVVAHPKLMCLDGDPESGLTEDDGLVVGLVGRPTGDVAVDMRSGRILGEDEAEESQELLGIEYPRFTRYDFRIEYVKITNGPKMREEQIHAAEQQRNQQETHMFSRMEQFFSKMMNKMGPSDSVATSDVSIQDVLANLKEQYTPEQIQAQLLMSEIEEEDALMVKKAEAVPSEDLTDDAKASEELVKDGNVQGD